MLLLHISDIHFKEAEVDQPDDPHKALRNDMIQDVKLMREKIGHSADGILLSGDVAHAGKATEYDFAYSWLENELCPAAGCKIQNVFVVPGNHDVDRKAEAGPAQRMLRSSLRSVAVAGVDDELRQWLRDRTSAAVIFGPIDNYNRFAAKFLCALGPYVSSKETTKEKEELPAQPFVKRDLDLNDGSILRLWGFNTVLVSDINDNPGLMFIDPAAAQIEVADDVTHVVICHHPFAWIKNKQAFEDRANAVAKIQLFGHEHTRRIDEAKRYLRIRAGALQPARDEPEWKPGYNWIDITVGQKKDKRSLDVKLWVRMHEVAQFIAITDPDHKEVWENTFELPAWGGRDKKSEKLEKDVPVQALESPAMQASTPVNVRSVTIKFFKLKEHEQRLLIATMRLDRPGDRELKDYELAINAIRRSRDEGSLGELDDQINKILADAGRA